jgi:putative colanic acid biosynthesis acetyltransferase WcaF
MHARTQLRSVTAQPDADPYLQPQTSFLNKVGRVLWGIVYVLLFRPTFRTMHGWRALLLRCFGAKLGPNCRIYRRAQIWAPWNLECEDAVGIADDAVIYNCAKVVIKSHALVATQSYVCCGTHDFDDPAFPMIVAPIHIGAYAWVCARACVLPGITVGEGAVLGLGGVASKDLEPWQVYVGNPAKRVKARRRFELPAASRSARNASTISP